MFYVGIYAAIGLSGAPVSVFSVTAQHTGALRASRVLFKYVLHQKRTRCCLMTFGNRQLLATVVHATFRFYDTTPQGLSVLTNVLLLNILLAGRMLNRFGKVRKLGDIARVTSPIVP